MNQMQKGEMLRGEGGKEGGQEAKKAGVKIGMH